jgi:Mn-dependent DtxR family transcriptional regulator
VPGPDPQHGDLEVLRAVSDTYGPAVGTSEVAEHLDVKTQTAAKYLNRLSDAGLVHTRKIGRVRVWWLSDRGQRELAQA